MILCDCFRLRQRVDQCLRIRTGHDLGVIMLLSHPLSRRDCFPTGLGQCALQAADGAVSVHTFRRAGCFTDAYRQFFRVILGKGRGWQQCQHHAAHKQDAEQSFFHLLHSSLSSASNVRFALFLLTKRHQTKNPFTENENLLKNRLLFFDANCADTVCTIISLTSACDKASLFPRTVVPD